MIKDGKSYRKTRAFIYQSFSVTDSGFQVDACLIAIKTKQTLAEDVGQFKSQLWATTCGHDHGQRSCDYIYRYNFKYNFIGCDGCAFVTKDTVTANYLWLFMFGVTRFMSPSWLFIYNVLHFNVIFNFLNTQNWLMHLVCFQLLFYSNSFAP